MLYLTDRAAEIVARLMQLYPVGRFFRNADGQPWRRNQVTCRFSRIQIRMGRQIIQEKGIEVDAREVEQLAKTIAQDRVVQGRRTRKSQQELLREATKKLLARMAKKHTPKLCLYHLRHSWMTRLLKAGVDPITVATLAGHADTSMLSRIYAHIQNDDDHLRNALRRA